MADTVDALLGTSSLAARIEAAIRAAGVAITGVSVGDETDTTTWRVTPATLQAAAQPTIDGFVIPDAVALLEEEAINEVGRKALRAVALGLWETIPAPTMTKPQLQARIVAIYKSL